MREAEKRCLSQSKSGNAKIKTVLSSKLLFSFIGSTVFPWESLPVVQEVVNWKDRID